MDPNAAAAQTNSRKRQRTASEVHAPSAPVNENAFIQDQDAGDSGADDDDEEEGKTKDKKAGRRKIKIEFIQDKSRRHITFSKRKAGIMKKAYELSTLTGTQVLLLVVSETGLVYTFTTAKLQPLVTQPEGKNLIQACLNAPHGQLPSSMPVGTPIGRSAAGSGAGAGGAGNGGGAGSGGQAANHPGGLAIGDEDDGGKSSDAEDARAAGAMGEKRRRAESGAALRSPPSANTVPTSAAGAQGGPVPGGPSPTAQAAQPPQQQQQPTAQQQFPQPQTYAQHPQDPASQQAMYPQHMMPPAGYYGGAPGGQQHPMQAHWGQQQALPQGQQYARR